mgnify:CR=1 FL=1
MTSCSRCGHPAPLLADDPACSCGGTPRIPELADPGRHEDWIEGPLDLWRYRRAFPFLGPSRAVTLGEGLVPLQPLEIAELERISRSQISRYLSRARELGIVKVSVSLPDIPGFSAMEKRLEKALGLEKVVIAPCSSNRELARRHAIASSASIYLLEVLRDAHIIGFGWGRTVYETSLQLPFSKDKLDRAI